MRAKFLAAMMSLTIVAEASGAGPAQLLTNGNFETGTFAGWTVDNLAGGSGDWIISVPGSVASQSGLATAPNASGGSFYALSDQGGPGTHVLRQSFTVPANAAKVTLSYQMFVNDSDSGPIIDPVGLDHAGGGANQHARVDILTSTATPFSTAPADVLANYYIGVDPQATNPNPYTSYSFDITGIVAPGGTYQLRFGEVDNQLFLNQGVDNVGILAEVPEPASIALVLCAGSALAAWRKMR